MERALSVGTVEAPNRSLAPGGGMFLFVLEPSNRC
jgi:hypothetical protein